MQVTCTPDKPWLFWLQEKPKVPKFEPHARIMMAQILGSLVHIFDCVLPIQADSYRSSHKWNLPHVEPIMPAGTCTMRSGSYRSSHK